MTPRLVLAALLVVVSLAGCGGSKPAPDSHLEMTGQQRLLELSELLSLAQTDLQRPPAKVQDLEKYRRGGPMAYQAVAGGQVVVLWGANLGQGSAVVAYEKDAPASGGWVLLQDRTVMAMTAAEFQSAPKASP
jgi:hypothetical protein